MSDQSPKFKREFTAEQIKGKHHVTLTPPELNQAFLDECERLDRIPADMIRLILKERYSAVEYPKSVEVTPKRKRDAA